MRWALAILLFAAHAASAQDISPLALTRALTATQNSAAAGQQGAEQEQRALLATLQQRLTAANPAEWQERALLRACIAYVLAGGGLAPARSGLAHAADVPERAWLAGAIAFAAGDGREAEKQWQNIDLATLPSAVAAPMALAIAALAHDDRPRLLKALDTARLVAPGSIFEEVALRRTLVVLDPMRERRAFFSLARRYTQMFAHSIYIDEFLPEFATPIVAILLRGASADFAAIDRIVAPLPPPKNSALFVSVAQMAALAANLSVARLAAHRVLRDPATTAAQRERVQVYEAAALVLTEPAAARASLARRAATDIPAEDIALRRAVLTVAEAILAPPNAPPRDARDDRIIAQATDEAQVARATQALAAADDALAIQRIP